MLSRAAAVTLSLPPGHSDNQDANHNGCDPNQSKRSDVFPQHHARRDDDADKLQRGETLRDVERQEAKEGGIEDENGPSHAN